ncbi:MAG: hypothetical protein ACRCUT_13955, partial [Spirochaetota bacterium]
ESGEYRLHQRVFGDDPKIWRNENPVEILRRSVRTRLYIFCESQSMYSAQADEMKNMKIGNVDLVDFRELGNGYSHNWKFWGNSRVVRALHEIFIDDKWKRD